MKEQIKKLKLELKSLARQIKQHKAIRKPSAKGHEYYFGSWEVSKMSSEFRHLHVAYCLARGRTLEQVDSGHKLDMDRVNWILASMNPESKEKLYVVVNENLSPSQQAVQSAHAVAEFLRRYPNTMWSNGYLVLLKDKPNRYGNMEPSGSFRYRPGNVSVNFIEPDLEGKITAYACFGPDVSASLKEKVLL